MKRTIIPVIAGLAALMLFMPAAHAHGKQATCREYTQVNRYGQITYGTACLQPNGTWLMIDPVLQQRPTIVYSPNSSTRITISEGPLYTFRDNGSHYRVYTNSQYGRYQQKHGYGNSYRRDRDHDHRHDHDRDGHHRH